MLSFVYKKYNLTINELPVIRFFIHLFSQVVGRLIVGKRTMSSKTSSQIFLEESKTWQALSAFSQSLRDKERRKLTCAPMVFKNT